MICLLSVRHGKVDVDGTVWGFDKAQETVGSAEARVIWILPLSLAMVGSCQFLFFLTAYMFHWVTHDGSCSREQMMWAMHLAAT